MAQQFLHRANVIARLQMRGALAWFCVDADTCLSTARWLKNASTSTAPVSCGAACHETE